VISPVSRRSGPVLGSMGYQHWFCSTYDQGLWELRRRHGFTELGVGLQIVMQDMAVPMLPFQKEGRKARFWRSWLAWETTLDMELIFNTSTASFYPQNSMVHRQLFHQYDSFRDPPGIAPWRTRSRSVAGLAWMCQQEESSVRGGILADEMGMGKTIQAGRTTNGWKSRAWFMLMPHN